MIISSSVRPAYPVLVQLKRRPGSRYLWHFPVGMFYAKEKADPDSIFEYHTAATAPAEEQRYLRELAEDIGTYRPMLIIVDAQDRRQGCPPAMNLWSFISRDEALMRALSAYSVSREVRGFRVFRR